MDILISDNWLREFLITKATPKQIEKYISLCGPSIEKVEKIGSDFVYHVEITTNRIDTVGIYGFARECAAILPRFGISAKLKKQNTKKPQTVGNKLPFTIINKEKLVYRAMGVVLSDIKNRQTPEWMKKRLEVSGLRSLNALVDVTNYIMLELGQPSHAFDYDKIKNAKFVIRESSKGEKVTSFDGKTYSLPGGDIVFDDGDGEIIDLPGIIGTKNSVVDGNTKRIFFFIDNNDPVRIRNTSMTLGIRTVAAMINEKGVDPMLSEDALLRGIELYKNICKVKVDSKIYDEYLVKPKVTKIDLVDEFINKRLGIAIAKDDITKYLTSLGFGCLWKGNRLSVTVPSFRLNDVKIPEDIVEEVARIYGYHNLPSNLMEGKIPDPLFKSGLPFEWKIKNILKALGGNEMFTLSLVSDKLTDNKSSLELKNPLGSDTKYLRNNLKNSLLEAVQSNKGQYDNIFLYELSNVYIPKKDELPEEKLTLGMVFDGYRYTSVKGIIETFLSKELKIEFEIEMESNYKIFNINAGKAILGYFEIMDDGKIVIELYVPELLSLEKDYISFDPISKHPPQIEDLTITQKAGFLYKDIVAKILKSDKRVNRIEYVGKYKDNITLKIYYLDENKTLEDGEIEEIRKKILKSL
ncbi:MAG TPA: phenylalanine--tRNA ligase subunit beta [Patescibacteria group bacterium]|nr:phenylalanine--tRNA ligase subunit beta [Patescibacteria group bacterium]